MSTASTPIVVILGATGAGKSQLALELAAKYGGEIISADAMQMYKGLDIVTNKVSEDEQSLVKHHMINILDPLSVNNVVDFRNRALPIVEKLLSENKIPFICGGTNYYIESLLWKILVDEDLPFMVNGKRLIDDNYSSANAKALKSDNKHEIDESEILNIESVDWSNDDGLISTRNLHETLKKVDPERASVLHPKERRKIWRSLQIFYRTGTKHSQILSQKQEGEGKSGFSGELRFGVKNICAIEVWSEKEILDARCDKRVDKMMKRGLLNELEQFHNDFNKLRADSDSLDNLRYTRGIWQSIGFKEFHNYLCLTSEERESEQGQSLFSECVERMKISTRQYSRRQAKWIRRRFLTSIRESPPVYRVDSSDPSLWKEKVFDPADSILQCFLAGGNPLIEPLPRICEDKERTEDFRKTLHCDVCDRDFKGETQYKNHLKGKSHKKAVIARSENFVYETWVMRFDPEEKMKVSKLIKDIFSIGLSEVMTKLETIPVSICQERSATKSKKIVNELLKHNIVAEVRRIKLDQENSIIGAG